MNIQNVKNILNDIPIYWINLERADKRRTTMIENFKKYDLVAERVVATDGNIIDIEELKKTYNITGKMNKYEIACALSHINTIKTCYEKKLDYVLILEDDATFDYFDYKKETFKFLLDELNKINGDSIQLCNIASKKTFPIYANSNKLLAKGNLASAVAYLITNTGMKKVLDNFENTKNINVSEHMIFKITNNFITKPYFSYQFLKNEFGINANLSFIRENNKSAHAVQTISKLLWDDYYLTHSK